MPTRRIMELTVVVGALLWPARATVRTWGRKQLATAQPGSVRYGVGEVIVTIV
jgi:hypothetical protein